MKDLIEDCFNRVRESKELGENSCSSVDECLTDDELREEIQNVILHLGDKATVETVFAKMIEDEETFMAIERDREAGAAFWGGW